MRTTLDLPMGTPLKEGITPKPTNTKSVYDSRELLLTDQEILYGDYREYNLYNQESMRRVLQELSETLIGTILRRGIPITLEWIVHHHADINPLDQINTIGWKGSFQRIVELNIPND